MSFEALGLSPTLLENLASLGYDRPTEIQSKAIPLVLARNDVLGIAQTGTGKTAAFALPLLQILSASASKKVTRSLILAPTRELVSQIHLSLTRYGAGTGLAAAAIYGGVGQTEQVRALREGVDIIVATPGRLLDLARQGHARLGRIECLVLDEADRMLDLGFLEDINAILELLPPEKQTLLFSATMPDPIVRLSQRILVGPELVKASPELTTARNIEERVFFCRREDKFQLLRKLLKEEGRELVVVFTRTKDTADKVKEYLRAHRIAAAVFHADKTQVDRERALENFKAGSMKIFIATDIAARGLDVPGITHVINFELPGDPETYVHRIGRTARAGGAGTAVSFCEELERPMLEKIQDFIQRKLPGEAFKGRPEAAGAWSQEGPIRQVRPPTPGKSQEKSAYVDHSKRQRAPEKGQPKKKPSHPGLRSRNKKR